MLITYGLTRNGQSNPAGALKRLGDLALFLKLSDANLTGPRRLLQPLIDWLARRAMKRGRLAELRDRYVTVPVMNH